LGRDADTMARKELKMETKKGQRTAMMVRERRGGKGMRRKKIIRASVRGLQGSLWLIVLRQKTYALNNLDRHESKKNIKAEGNLSDFGKKKRAKS